MLNRCSCHHFQCMCVCACVIATAQSQTKFIVIDMLLDVLDVNWFPFRLVSFENTRNWIKIRGYSTYAYTHTYVKVHKLKQEPCVYAQSVINFNPLISFSCVIIVWLYMYSVRCMRCGCVYACECVKCLWPLRACLCVCMCIHLNQIP